jgi:hypothetical protein
MICLEEWLVVVGFTAGLCFLVQLIVYMWKSIINQIKEIRKTR